MKRTLLTIVLLYCFSVYSQNDVSTMADANGDFRSLTFSKEQITESGSLSSARWQQKNLDPGVSPEGDYMGQAVFSPDGQKVYLTNRGTNYLTVLDYVSMTMDTNILLGEYPSCIDANEDYIVVGCQFSDHVYILETGTYVILDSVLVNEQPCRIHISPVGDTAFIACDIENVCIKIDLQNQIAVQGILDFPIYLQTFSMSTQSARNWIKYSDFAITPDGTGLITHNGQDQIMLFNAVSGEVSQTINISSPRAFAFSGDNTRIICAANQNNVAKLYQISFPGFQLLDSVEVTGYSIATNQVVVNQDGSKAYIGSGSNTSTLVRFETHDFKTFTSTYTAFWLGISPDHRYVVSGQNHFSIVDMETEEITDMYSGLNQSWGIVSPVDNYVFSYDPLLFEGNYYFDFTDPADIQLMGSTLSGKLPEGDAPYRVAMLNSNYKAVTVNNLSYNCSLIDYENKEVIGTVDLGEACYDVIVTQDDQYAVLGGYNNNKVKIVELATMELVAEVNTAQRPMELTYAPMLNRVYAANIKSNSISVIQLDGASSSLVTNIPCGVIGVYIPFFGIRSGVEISPDENYLLVAASFDDKVKIIDAGTNQVVADLTVGDFPLAIGFNEDGTRACVSNLFDHTYSILRIDGANSEVITTQDAGGDYPVDVNFNMTEGLFYVCDYNTKNVVKVDPESGDIVESVNLNYYGGAFQVEFFNDEAVFLTIGVDDVPPGVFYQDTLFELPGSASHMNLAEFGTNQAYAGVTIPGPDFLSVINLDESVSINIPSGYEENEIKVYPNPSAGRINIESEKMISKLEVYNVQGETVIDLRLSTTNYELRTTNFSPGTYFIRLKLKDGSATNKKIVVGD